MEILENLEDEDDIDTNINEKWENIKTIIKETKQQLIEKDENTETLNNIWCNEECKIAIEETKKARGSWLTKGRRENESRSINIKKEKRT
jgi:predicted transcriptional regulator